MKGTLETGNCELRSVYTTLASNQGAFFEAREGRDHILVRATMRKIWSRKNQIFRMATSMGIRIKRIQMIARRTLNGCAKRLPRDRLRRIPGIAREFFLCAQTKIDASHRHWHVANTENTYLFSTMKLRMLTKASQFHPIDEGLDRSYQVPFGCSKMGMVRKLDRGLLPQI